MVSERIDDSSYAPTMLVVDGPYHSGSCRHSPFESRIGIFHDHDYPHRTAAERLRTEVEGLRCLVGQPEFGFPNGQLSDHLPALAFDAKQLGGPERRLVELNRPL